jgi:hypothetical protein
MRRWPRWRDINGGIVSMPVAIVSREHEARLARLAESGEVRVWLNLVNKPTVPTNRAT